MSIFRLAFLGIFGLAFSTILVSICVLVMLTVGIMGSLPISATQNSSSIPGTSTDNETQKSSSIPRPLYTEQYVTLSTNWYVGYTNCYGISNHQFRPVEGLYIDFADYKQHSMIDHSYQTGIQWSPWVKPPTSAYQDYLDQSQSCTYSHWTDGGGYVHYGNLYRFDDIDGWTGIQLYYNVSFAATATDFEFYQSFTFVYNSTHKALTYDSWWKSKANVNATSCTVIKNGNTITKEDAGDKSTYWSGDEEFKVNSNTYLKSDSYGTTGNYSEWAAFKTIEDYFHHDYSASDLETLPGEPLFSEYVYKYNPGSAGIPSGNTYYSYTLWKASV